jgi:Carboxypeptidase regulatory-like domain
MFPALIAVAVSLLQTSSSIASKPGNKIPPPCSVSGRIVATDGTPLKSARVALLVEHGTRESHAYAAISDSSGRFTLKDVPAGRYHFLATHTGYVD